MLCANGKEFFMLCREYIEFRFSASEINAAVNMRNREKEMIGSMWTNPFHSTIVVYPKQYPLSWHHFSGSSLTDGVNGSHYVCLSCHLHIG